MADSSESESSESFEVPLTHEDIEEGWKDWHAEHMPWLQDQFTRHRLPLLQRFNRARRKKTKLEEADKAVGADEAVKGDIDVQAAKAVEADEAVKADIAVQADKAVKADETGKADIAVPASRVKADEAVKADIDIAVQADKAVKADEAVKADIAVPASRVKADEAVKADIAAETTVDSVPKWNEAAMKATAAAIQAGEAAIKAAAAAIQKRMGESDADQAGNRKWGTHPPRAIKALKIGSVKAESSQDQSCQGDQAQSSQDRWINSLGWTARCKAEREAEEAQSDQAQSSQDSDQAQSSRINPRKAEQAKVPTPPSTEGGFFERVV